jgi:hypothetical protein
MIVVSPAMLIDAVHFFTIYAKNCTRMVKFSKLRFSYFPFDWNLAAGGRNL